MDSVRPERTGWRDQEISERHRMWGFNCPAVDLDFLMVEYNQGKPVGLIEYKHFMARMPDVRHPTYRALIEMADAAGLPFMLAFYWPALWAFKVWPINQQAIDHFQRGEMLCERDFVLRLYRMRRLVLASHLAGKLNVTLPGTDEAA